MRAWRFDRWTRIARDPMTRRLVLPLLLLAAFVAGWGAVALAQSKSAADSAADESGIVVKVRESESDREAIARAREKVAQAELKAEKAAERAAALAERSRAKVPPPPPPGTVTPPDIPDVPDVPDFAHSEGNDLVRFGEDIVIPEGRTIEGDVVAVGGSITVLGRVKGDCVAVGGMVRIQGKGAVEGDAVSLGGGVVTSDSATVGGSDVSVGKFDFGHMNHAWPMMGAMGVFGTGMWLVQALVGLAITLFLAWISMLLLGSRLENAAQIVQDRFGRSFLTGLLGWALLVLAVPVGVIALILAGVIAIVILCITIIGIPVAILLLVGLVLAIVALVVGVVYAGFLGYLTGTMYLGRRLLGNRVAANPLYAIAAGVLLIAVLRFVGKIIGLASFFVFHPVGLAFGFAAGLLAFIVATAGLGAMMSGRFVVSMRPGATGYAQWGSATAPPPPPPPPPPAPAPGPTGPTVAPPPDGSSDAP
jgi:hypothetical protein